MSMGSPRKIPGAAPCGIPEKKSCGIPSGIPGGTLKGIFEKVPESGGETSRQRTGGDETPKSIHLEDFTGEILL